MADNSPQQPLSSDAPEAGGAGETFEPSTAEANRTRMQGGGMGQKELDGQQDPTRGDESDKV